YTPGTIGPAREKASRLLTTIAPPRHLLQTSWLSPPKGMPLDVAAPAQSSAFTRVSFKGGTSDSGTPSEVCSAGRQVKASLPRGMRRLTALTSLPLGSVALALMTQWSPSRDQDDSPKRPLRSNCHDRRPPSGFLPMICSPEATTLSFFFSM